MWKKDSITLSRLPFSLSHGRCHYEWRKYAQNVQKSYSEASSSSSLVASLNTRFNCLFQTNGRFLWDSENVSHPRAGLHRTFRKREGKQKYFPKSERLLVNRNKCGIWRDSNQLPWSKIIPRFFLLLKHIFHSCRQYEQVTDTFHSHKAWVIWDKISSLRISCFLKKS